jgi:hypothetical protein
LGSGVDKALDVIVALGLHVRERSLPASRRSRQLTGHETGLAICSTKSTPLAASSKAPSSKIFLTITTSSRSQNLSSGFRTPDSATDLISSFECGGKDAEAEVAFDPVTFREISLLE